jgi:hypothetical protein
MTCPCCGVKFEGDMQTGCAACGARQVGPPLARPSRLLPTYGRALAVGAAGAILFFVLLSGTVAALFENKPLSFGFWKIVSAFEAAAWRLKWTALPFALAALYLSARVRRRIGLEPLRFAGARFARVGLALSAFVVVGIVAAIAVTVPERLRQRELALRAADESLVYATHRVLLQYRTRFGSLPSAASDLRRLPDPDGSVAAVRTTLEAGDYSPEANLASLPSAATKSRGRGARAGAVRVSNVALKENTDDSAGELLSLTNYALVLPGRDKILNTPDDIRVRDGALLEGDASSAARRPLDSSKGDEIIVP